MTRNFKSLVQSERTFLAGLLCLVGIVAFILGQQSMTETGNVDMSERNQAGIVFTDVTEPVINSASVTVVASSGGTKYHLLNCSGVNRINEENKIYFTSVEEAKAAGYEPAANCEF